MYWFSFLRPVEVVALEWLWRWHLCSRAKDHTVVYRIGGEHLAGCGACLGGATEAGSADVVVPD